MTKLNKWLPVCGFAIAIGLVGITSAFKDAPKQTNSQQTEYYFAYSAPTTGQEDDESQWTPITQLEYTTATCDGQIHGCVLATTNVTGSGLNMRPDTVYVDIVNGEFKPVVGDDVQDVRNRDNSATH